MNNDETTVLKCLLMLKAAYPRQELGEETINLYEMALSDIDPELLQTSVLRHIAASKWFPTVAELREAALSIIARANGDQSASEAWGQVMRQISAVGHWRPPEFDDPLIYKVLEAIGGWKWLCHSDNITADRARFIQAYEIMVNRRREDAMMLPAVRDYTRQLADGNGVQTAVKMLAAKMSGKETQ